MREIKFRVWNLGEKRMYFLDCIWNIPTPTSGSFNLMQYTELNDINGKEIYEGDIIKPKNHSGNWTGVVKYTKGVPWIYEVAGESSKEESIWSGSIKCEIIGNIHENPELTDN